MLRWTPDQLAAHRARQAKMRTGIAERNAAPPKKVSEHDIQVEFFAWAKKQAIPGIELLHATPNGGLRTKAQAGKLKAEGVKAGHPDVSWPVARGGFIGLAIEFKADDGNPTKEQRERMDALQREGWMCCVCWSSQAAARTLTGYASLARLEPIAEPKPEPVKVWSRDDVVRAELRESDGCAVVAFRDGCTVQVAREAMASSWERRGFPAIEQHACDIRNAQESRA